MLGSCPMQAETAIDSKKKVALEEAVSKALHEIPRESRDFLSLSFGLGENRRHGLEEISKALGKRKKHCEGLFDRSVRLLRRPRLWKQLSGFVGVADACMWSAVSKEISNAGSIVPDFFGEAFEKKTQRAAGEAELLLRVRYGDLGEWVKTTSSESANAWYRSRYSEETVDEALLYLSRELDDSKGLMLRESFLEKLNDDEPLFQLVLELSDLNLLPIRKFIVKRPVTSMVLRGIRLYLLLFFKYKCSLVKIDVLIDDFYRMYPDDKLNEDIAKRVLERFPRLLGVFGGAAWARGYYVSDALKPKPQKDADNRQDALPRYRYDRPWDDMGVGEIIRDVVEYRGIATFVEIIDDFNARTGGRYHEANVQGVLRTSDTIVAFTPIYYGLRDELSLSSSRDKYYSILANQRSCIRFIWSRYAGEPLGSYPLWTPELEYWYCRWAESESQVEAGLDLGGDSDYWRKQKIFQSLLAVAEPDCWTVSEEEKKLWRLKKQSMAKYRFAQDFRQGNWMNTIALQEIFSLAVLTGKLGFMNWIRANAHIYKSRNRKKAAAVMVFLVAMEILRPAKHWQQRHEPGDGIDQAVHAMVSEIRKKGFVHWKDDAGRKMIARIKENIGKGKDFGWVKAEDVAAVMAHNSEQWETPGTKPKQIQLELPF